MSANKRPCGACRHIDSRTTAAGAAYCWRFYVWRRPEEVVVDCDAAERPDGKAPPGQVTFGKVRP